MKRTLEGAFGRIRVRGEITELKRHGSGHIYLSLKDEGAKIGAVNVGVNWRLAPVEMAEIVNDAEAKVLFVGPDFLAHLEKMEDLLSTGATQVVSANPGCQMQLEAGLRERGRPDVKVRHLAELIAEAYP